MQVFFYKHHLNFWVIIVFISFMVLSCNQTVNETGNNEQENKPYIEVLDQELVENPQNADLYNERAIYFLKQDEINNALADINQALQIDSLNADYFLTLADIYQAMGSMSSCLAALDKAGELSPENKEMMISKAKAFLVIMDYKKVYEFVKMALETDEYFPEAYFIRGVALTEQGDTAAAVRSFMTAVEQDNNYFDAQVQLGLIYAEKLDPLAEAYYVNALKISPENTDVHYLLGLYYQETGAIDKAISKYEDAIDLDPDFAQAFFNLGYIYLVYINDFEMAIDFFSKAISLNENYVEAWFNRGYSYELLGNTENARLNYKKALDIETNYEKAIQGLNRLENR